LTAHVHSVATAGVPRSRPSALVHAAATLRRVAQRIAEWLETRERFAADRDVLARMSDRELLDIGLDRARANVIAGDVHDACHRGYRMR
jgi:uncharacterized protein YjiS (DUF1127 family)